MADFREQSTDGTIKAGSTAAVATDLSLVVALSPNSPLPSGTNPIGTVAQAAITKGTQGATGITTQDLKDAGRNLVTYYTLTALATTAVDTLQSLTGTKGGVTVAATTTPAVVTAGKTFRVTRVHAAYNIGATTNTAIGYAIVKLRFNTAGAVLITSPVGFITGVGSAGTATDDAAIPDGSEFPAGTGIGISVQGFSGTAATAIGFVLVAVSGYEY